jgi:membrane protease subunit (stomatin/prohibitin family)
MSDKIAFVDNYQDLSTPRGFQFEFSCGRCGKGYRSRFVPSVTGTISNVLGAASSLFGGVFSQAENLGSRVHDAAWEKAHDDEFVKAQAEMRPEFMQCPRCRSWVCKKDCWNEKRGLCKGCAPDLGVEMSAAQASRSVEEIWAHAAMAEEDKKLATENWNETIVASCPKCQTPLQTNAKFCPNCGANLKTAAHCTECGAKLAPNAKFCADCGTKVS